MDNDSNDGTSSLIEIEYPEVILIRLSKNIGCAGRNEGIKRASGDIIITFDDDVFLGDKDALEKTLKVFDENK